MKYKKTILISSSLDMVLLIWRLVTWNIVPINVLDIILLDSLLAAKLLFIGFCFTIALLVPASWRRGIPYLVNNLLMINIVFLVLSIQVTKIVFVEPANRRFRRAMQKYQSMCINSSSSPMIEKERQILLNQYPYQRLNGSQKNMVEFKDSCQVSAVTQGRQPLLP